MIIWVIYCIKDIIECLYLMIWPLFRFLGQKFVKFFGGFLENLRHLKDILKLTDLYILSNWWWRFCQFLWPSQKTWTLLYCSATLNRVEQRTSKQILWRIQGYLATVTGFSGFPVTRKTNNAYRLTHYRFGMFYSKLCDVCIFELTSLFMDLKAHKKWSPEVHT